jgi:hypothetical protein
MAQYRIARAFSILQTLSMKIVGAVLDRQNIIHRLATAKCMRMMKEVELITELSLKSLIQLLLKRVIQYVRIIKTSFTRSGYVIV